MATVSQKSRAVLLAKKIGIKAAQNILNIPEKSIRRWMQNGVFRKVGAGWKVEDSNMEKELVEWIKKTS